MAVDPIWFKEVECMACGAKQKVPRVRSSALKAKAVEPDFHKIYEEINPVLYAVTTCNECNYSARNEDYDKLPLDYHKEILDIALAIKNAKRNVVFPNGKEISYDEALKKHQLAITFYKHFKPTNPNTIAGLYMHIVWMYREQGNTEKENEFKKQAVEWYTATFERGVHIPEKIGLVGIMYLVGELKRQLGENNDAVTWFARIMQNEEIDAYPNIRNLAKDAWEKITEEKRKKQSEAGK
ncbi:MAG TPA: DUF2225 domain-containing protein [Firmicutes bacterium]|nr:DUF2225 domain-containing protein [Bacillota bacterium]